jgi:replicative DNA helicase
MVTEKIQPHDIDAEESTIGSVLIDNQCFRKVLSIITNRDFYDERNSWLFAAFEALDSRRESINQITVAQELERQGRLENCGGAAYMSHLISIVPTSMDAEYYAEIVRRLSFDRQLVNVSQAIEKEALLCAPDTNAVIEKVTDLLSRFKQRHVQTSLLITPQQTADRLIEMVNGFADKSVGIPFGFKDLDNMTGGLFPGELTVIGGDSGTGKTELFMNIMENITNKIILFVSVEMKVTGLLERKVARQLRVSIVELRKGNMPFEALQQVGLLTESILESSLYITEKVNTSTQIYNLVSQMKETTGVDIVFVDYIQRLRDTKMSKDRNDLDIGRAVSNLKSTAMDFDIPVVAISSFNRDARNRPDKTPILSDLRGSGEIQYEADNIYLVNRNTNNPDFEKYGDPKLLRCKLEKGRQIGTLPSVTLVWNDERRRYVDYFKDRHN